MARLAKEGERVPWIYGRSYYDFDRQVTVCHIMPFNWIVPWFRSLWFSIRKGPNTGPYAYESHVRRLEAEVARQLSRATTLQDGINDVFRAMERGDLGAVQQAVQKVRKLC